MSCTVLYINPYVVVGLCESLLEAFQNILTSQTNSNLECCQQVPSLQARC